MTETAKPCPKCRATGIVADFSFDFWTCKVCSSDWVAIEIPSLEIHEDWIFEVAGKFRSAYGGDIDRFSLSHGIDYLDAFWFFKGNPVRSDAFKAICRILGLDWEKISRARLD